MKYEFSAMLKQHEGIDGAYVEIPFDVEEAFGAKRVKVKAAFDGYSYRGSIVRMSGCYLIGVQKNIRKLIGKSPGEYIAVELEKDEAERIAELPADFTNKLEEIPGAKAFFDSLSFSHKREFEQWFSSAKKEETRQARMDKALDLLREGKTLK